MRTALPVPKYHQIYLVLREQLHEGRFSSGMPGEIALMRKFGVARVTVRKALERLAAERLIRRTPGRGTMPLPQPPQVSIPAGNEAADGEQVGSWFEGLSAASGADVKVLSVRTLPCLPVVAQALQIAAGSMVQKAQRVRLVREGPQSHITTYVPQALAPFGRRQLARTPILVLMEDAGVQIGHATQSMSARLADAEVARHLGVAVGTALLAVQRLVFDRRGRPVQWLLGLYRPDRYEVRVELARLGGVDAKVWVSKSPSAQLQ
ncbi:MAG TPA: GntR family transcriptional regulator [Burkholderiaceae bacterium]|nr:GntR family transcriptional regulator [Burkholderiaceae bacterium]HSC00682.1 GntR family transcriptional regulator [Burkholderiaceae bacterium]